MDIEKIIARARPDILKMKSYVSARSMINADEKLVFLDANECAYAPYIGAENINRYPAQQPRELTQTLSRLYKTNPETLLITRGADEAIDIILRSFCTANQDRIIICPPTFPMYAQAAYIQGAHVDEIPLTTDFCLDTPAIVSAVGDATKLVFVCTPNNPTANTISRDDILNLSTSLKEKCLIIVDETYVEYAGMASLAADIEKHPNLIILRTISKAYAAAGLRCGCAIAHEKIIDILRKVLAPYPIPQPVAQQALKILSAQNIEKLKERMAETLRRKEWFKEQLGAVEDVITIFPSDANFILVQFKDSKTIMDRARAGGFILRDQSHHQALPNCIRITISSDDEMTRLMNVIAQKECVYPTGRSASLTRVTKETQITATINLDRAEPVRITTGIGFYDHMLEQIARHGGFSLTMDCTGDLDIDNHHTIEDCAILLGSLLKKSLGDKAGIGRYGFTVPMDESLAEVAIDLSGRFFLKFDGVFPDRAVGDFPSDMTAHVFRSLCENLQATCHIKVTGENTHHMIEACFKAFGRALRQAVKCEGDIIPSSKGTL